MSHLRTLELVISQVRISFQPKHDPSRKLAEEIESCKRKIWECIDPAERKQYFEKKQKKHMKQDGYVESNSEDSRQSSINRPPVVTAKIGQQSSAIKNWSQPPPKQSTQTRSDIELKIFVMKVVELKKELKERGCDTAGLKKDLRTRLISVMLEQLDQEEPNKIAGVSYSNTIVESIMEHKEISDTVEISKDNIPDSIDEELDHELVPPPPLNNSSDHIPQEDRRKESMSSMQVEHHSTGIEQVKTMEIAQEDNEEKQENPIVNCSSGQVHNVSTSSICNESSKRQENSVTAISEEAVFSSLRNSASDVSSGCPPTEQEETPEVAAPLLKSRTISEIKETSFDNDDISAPASEVSFSSKASGSGHSVKDMVSKFSGFSSLPSSSSGGSALSKGLQAKKEARQAKIAEMRAKSKPVTSSKTALTSKEYSTTLSSLNATASKTTSAKKKNLATQMREKAAAHAYKNKMTNPVSKTVTKTTMGSTNKRILPFTNNSNNSNIAAHNPPGATLKQAGVNDSLGAKLKQDALLKKSKVMSPMDTYEISDREDSDTDDSDSDSENEKTKKKIPTWALRANLYPALEKQYNGHIGSRKVDPDEIFPEVQSCDLEAIFGTKKAKAYRSRASSGNWAQDKVTVAEKLVYKREMGFATDTEVTEI